MGDKNPLEMIESLLENKILKLSDGASVICGEHINLTISRSAPNTIITFSSPYPYLLISKLGPVPISEIKRKVNSVSIGPSSYTVSVDDFPDITRARE